MRRHGTPFGLAFIALILALPLLAGPTFAAEVTRTLRVELTANETESFAIENLAGSISVKPGPGDRLVAIATVHAESDELADQVRFERVEDTNGKATLRVRYPLDEHRTFRYPGSGSGGFLSGLFGSGSSTSGKYDGRKVKVTSKSGVLLYADVEVQVPEREVDARFSNFAGPLNATGLKGSLEFDTASGDVTVSSLDGRVEIDTGSGDIRASSLVGSLSCDTGSGNCTVDKFSGDKIDGDTGSGDIIIRDSTVAVVSTDTGSGDIRVESSDLGRFDADTGSGDIVLSSGGESLTRVDADTGSGDVTLRLGAEASFEIRSSQGSGDLVSRYSDAEAILDHRELVGYRRGDGRIRIRVDTGSGDVLVEPGGTSARK